MQHSFTVRLAETIVSGIRQAGYRVTITRLERRKRMADHYSDLPGIKLVAEPLASDGKARIVVTVRDWSVERYELEAAMMLDHTIKSQKAPIRSAA